MTEENQLHSTNSQTDYLDDDDMPPARITFMEDSMMAAELKSRVEELHGDFERITKLMETYEKRTSKMQLDADDLEEYVERTRLVANEFLSDIRNMQRKPKTRQSTKTFNGNDSSRHLPAAVRFKKTISPPRKRSCSPTIMSKVRMHKSADWNIENGISDVLKGHVVSASVSENDHLNTGRSKSLPRVSSKNLKTKDFAKQPLMLNRKASNSRGISKERPPLKSSSRASSVSSKTLAKVVSKVSNTRNAKNSKSASRVLSVDSIGNESAVETDSFISLDNESQNSVISSNDANLITTMEHLNKKKPNLGHCIEDDTEKELTKPTVNIKKENATKEAKDDKLAKKGKTLKSIKGSKDLKSMKENGEIKPRFGIRPRTVKKLQEVRDSGKLITIDFKDKGDNKGQKEIKENSFQKSPKGQNQLQTNKEKRSFKGANNKEFSKIENIAGINKDHSTTTAARKESLDSKKEKPPAPLKSLTEERNKKTTAVEISSMKNKEISSPNEIKNLIIDVHNNNKSVERTSSNKSRIPVSIQSRTPTPTNIIKSNSSNIPFTPSPLNTNGLSKIPVRRNSPIFKIHNRLDAAAIKVNENK